MNKRQKLVQEQFLNNEDVVLKRLKQVYDQSLKDVTGKISDLDKSIGALQKALADVNDDEVGDLARAFLGRRANISPAEAKETLQSMLQSKVYQKRYQEALKGQIDGIMDKMHGKEYKVVSDYLKECYEDGFIGTMFDLQGQGIPLCFPLDQEAMVRAVQLDSKISQGLYSRLGEDVAILKKKITAQVSRGIATGMSFRQVARGLTAYTNIGYNNAVRIARTEGHRIQVQGAMDACYKAKEKGADVVKQWDSTLDGKTRESHSKVDGEIRELDKPFSNGLMFPGDPSGGAAEVVNCRCALLQRARWALDDAELETLQKRAEYFGLDKSETFEEYKKTYLKAAEQIRKEKPEVGKRQRRTRRPDESNSKISSVEVPDFDSMDKKELDAWISGHLQTQFISTKGVVEDFLRETTKVLYDFEQKMGGNTIKGLKISFGTVGRGRYAAFDFKTGTLHLKKTGSLKDFLDSQHKENELSVYRRKKVWHSTEGFAGTVWHELGHAVDYDMGQNLSRALSASKELDLKSIQISGYAGSSPAIGAPKRSEAWAENFAAYMSGNEQAQNVPPEIAKMIEEYFKSKLG